MERFITFDRKAYNADLIRKYGVGYCTSVHGLTEEKASELHGLCTGDDYGLPFIVSDEELQSDAQPVKPKKQRVKK